MARCVLCFSRSAGEPVHFSPKHERPKSTCLACLSCGQVRIVLKDVEGLYTTDPEGLGIATRINQQLPPSVQVTERKDAHNHVSSRYSSVEHMLASGPELLTCCHCHSVSLVSHLAICQPSNKQMRAPKPDRNCIASRVMQQLPPSN